ncbi:hypothetical protein [Allobranchiibius sp. GilTou38]|uniref:hypothetical protein n=1 Tax=Allobranchiibius sp. GilTou38 TaxID=2815210 RepID=UPI001AA192B5|nr:hypothetical protein [Allobranchiibius sp. GilTou38]
MMSRSNAVGSAISFLIPVYAVLIGLAGAPWWGIVVVVMLSSAYWSFGRRIFFPDEFEASSKDPMDPRSARRAARAERRSGRWV